jgi:hypothetical protein
MVLTRLLSWKEVTSSNEREVVREEITQLLDVIYPIFGSKLVSVVQRVPKKVGFVVVPNKSNEWNPTRGIVGYGMCTYYMKLNNDTHKYHYVTFAT